MGKGVGGIEIPKGVWIPGDSRLSLSLFSSLPGGDLGPPHDTQIQAYVPLYALPPQTRAW